MAEITTACDDKYAVLAVVDHTVGLPATGPNVTIFVLSRHMIEIATTRDDEHAVSATVIAIMYHTTGIPITGPMLPFAVWRHMVEVARSPHRMDTISLLSSH